MPVQNGRHALYRKPTWPGHSGGVEQLEAEQRLRAACARAGIGLSVVRLGTLKGGGPGRAENGVDVGLARPYYDNVMDIETYA